MADIDSEHGKTKLTLFSDVEAAGTVRIVISTAEELAEDGVVSVCTVEQKECRRRREGRRVQRFGIRAHTRVEGEDVRLLHALGLDVPAGEVVLQHADETFFWVVARLRAAQSSEVVWWVVEGLAGTEAEQGSEGRKLWCQGTRSGGDGWMVRTQRGDRDET